MPTRAQQDLALAEARVTEVLEADEVTRRIYGGLCHSLPVLVRSCGLCQALAFSAAKAQAGGDAESPRRRAHDLLLRHVEALLNSRAGQDDVGLLDRVRTADTLTYMLYTRHVLQAWVYFKRFAESILKVTSSEEGDRDG